MDSRFRREDAIRTRCRLIQGTTTPLRRKDLPALTGVRFLAAWYVVLFHAYPGFVRRYPVPRAVETFLSNGYLAVGLFFLLSGFILAYTYEGNIDGRARRARFWEARFARIYPVYLLSLVMAFAFSGELALSTRAAVIGMVQAWNPFNSDMAGAWNYPAWTLSAEAFFYICFPFVLPWLSRRSERALYWLMAALLVICVLGHTPVKGLGDWKNHAGFFVRYVPLPALRFPEFLLGVVMGLRFLRAGNAEKRPGRPLVVCVAVLGTLAALSLPIGDWVSLVILPFSVLVYELACGGTLLTEFLSTRVMVLLGGASYSVYLLRYPVSSWMRVLVDLLPPAFVRAGELLTPVVLVLFSIAVFRYWEEPARVKLRHWFAIPQLKSLRLAVASPARPNGARL
jgi:peptidoglycan/LPS O-acetylase OafA/YrhL